MKHCYYVLENDNMFAKKSLLVKNKLKIHLTIHYDPLSI